MTQSRRTSRRGRPPRKSTIALRFPYPLSQKLKLVAKARDKNLSDYVWERIEYQLASDARKISRTLPEFKLTARRNTRKDEDEGDLVYTGLQYPWATAQAIRVVATGFDMKVSDYIRDIIEEHVLEDARRLARVLEGVADFVESR